MLKQSKRTSLRNGLSILKMRKVMFWILTVFIIGFPNFAIFSADEVGNSIQINNTIILRAILILILIIYIFFSVIYYPKIRRSIYKAFRYPIMFYLCYLITIIFSSQKIHEMIISTFRIMEYLVYFTFLAIFLQKYYIPDSTFKKIIICCAYYLKILATLSIVYLIIHPMADGRLGLPIIHPNTLGILSTIGMLTSYYLQRPLMRILGLTFFSIVCLLTLSKGALMSLLLAIVIPNFLSTSKISTKVIQIIISALFLYLVWLIVSSAAFMRGQDISYLYEISGRFQVWQSAYMHITKSYQNVVFGIGFGEGTSIINDYMFNAFSITHWKTHNAHNDILQAWLSGGIFYFVATLYIFWSSYNFIMANEYELRARRFHLSILIVNFTFGMSMTTVNYYIGPISSLIWLQFILLRLDYYNKTFRFSGDN
jgi:hypothetical protein